MITTEDIIPKNPTTLQANQHIGAGLAGGSVALSKGFKILKQRPELKEKIVEELKESLLNGLKSAKRQYPIIELFTPAKLYIMQNENAAKAWVKSELKRVENSVIISGMKEKIIAKDSINYNYLKNIAIPYENINNMQDFFNIFNVKKGKITANVKTPIKEIEINVKTAWEHLLNNSKNENRIKIAGAILPSLKEPNIISKDKKGTYYFYKAFKDEKGVLNLISISIPKSNRLKYKTSYISSKQRLMKILNEYEIIYSNF